MEPKVSEFLLHNGLKVEYPNNKKFALCLTHDIDQVNYDLFTIGYFYMKGKINVGQSAKMIFNKVSKKLNYLWNFEMIMNLEDKYGAKSSFYILTLEKDEQDYTFNVDTLRDELKNIIDRGWEVGLHGGHEAFDDVNKIKKAKKKLETVTRKKIIGYRNHFLKFKVPDTWEHLHNAGIKYDTTLGYTDCVGFRNGMCHPFKPFNLNTAPSRLRARGNSL